MKKVKLDYRFHGALVDHLLQFQYSIAGALQLIQDVHQYKQTVHHFKVREGKQVLFNFLIEIIFDNIRDAL